MTDEEWKDLYRPKLEKAEQELSDFKSEIDKNHLRVIHRDINGEHDVTDDRLRDLEAAVEEYRAVLRDA